MKGTLVVLTVFQFLSAKNGICTPSRKMMSFRQFQYIIVL